MLSPYCTAVPSQNLVISRLDCQAFWCNPFIPSGVSGRLSYVSNGAQLCASGQPQSAWQDNYLLVTNSSVKACVYGDVLANAKVCECS